MIARTSYMRTSYIAPAYLVYRACVPRISRLRTSYIAPAYLVYRACVPRISRLFPARLRLGKVLSLAPAGHGLDMDEIATDLKRFDRPGRFEILDRLG